MGILIPIFGILTGMVAIIASTYLKAKKMEIDKLNAGGGNLSHFKNLNEKLELLEKENELLKQRLHNVELIATSKEWDLLPPSSSELSVSQQSEEIAKKLS